ncbi:hypothetical protein [Tautonia sociabilis]|uniref:Uncharacterized protein n=1 Tax=Tautonia sociabilis TaxID=2080755 RepID=A0A432MIK5_9BACT|nr:hypothetical protein [Tautonia sociabilis]RUL87129.1 hypothetical protein TsocGM_13685 [Tautonia sociabilis]
MADSSSARLLLIVTGSALRAEEVDRPLAYYLRKQVEEHLLGREGDRLGFRVRVVSDLRWLHDETFQELPTISVGGPGVNLLAHRWLEELPLSLAVEGQYFIQMDPDLNELKASIWGMDNPNTQIAVSAFVNRFLPRFIDRCLAEAPDAIDLDEFD